jgi:hypothetical protein
MRIRRLATWFVVGILSVAVGCGDDGASTSGTGGGGGGAGGSSTSQGGAAQGGGSSVGGQDQGGASAQGGGSSVGGQGQGGGAMSDARLVGSWKPTQFIDSGMETIPAGPNDPYFVFNADGTFAFGCGAPAGSTWTFEPNGPQGTTGVIKVLIGGSSMVQWVVTELTDTTFVFTEGGDQFFFERADCP